MTRDCWKYTLDTVLLSVYFCSNRGKVLNLISISSSLLASLPSSVSFQLFSAYFWSCINQVQSQNIRNDFIRAAVRSMRKCFLHLSKIFCAERAPPRNINWLWFDFVLILLFCLELFLIFRKRGLSAPRSTG